jgi:Ribbon-helix-helix protein, copG family
MKSRANLLTYRFHNYFSLRFARRPADVMVFELLDRLAKKEGLQASDLIRRAIRQYLEGSKK